jgi:glycerol uptake facilitator-like aquaporin
MLINLSKFIVELAGTTVLGLFYLTVGDKQTGMLLGYWIITLFAVHISGAHFNPVITLVTWLRRGNNFGTRKLRVVIYLLAQVLGGVAAAALSKFILNDT